MLEIKVGDLVRQKIGYRGKHLTESAGLVIDKDSYGCRVWWTRNGQSFRCWINFRELQKVEKNS
jgi:hypothetical protein